MSIAGKLGAVYRTVGSSTAFTNEATNSDSTHKRYTIAANVKRYWDDTNPIVVKVNGTVRSTGFHIEYAGGVVVFDIALGTSDVVTVSGNYFNTQQCSTFFDWKLDTDTDMKDVTTFASGGFREYIPMLKGWNASADGYWADESFAGLVGQRIIVALYVDSTSDKRYEGYIMLKKNSIQEKTNDVVSENVEFQGTGELYYHE